MKRLQIWGLLMTLFVLVSPVLANGESENSASVIIQKENGLVDWTQNYVEATGTAIAPSGVEGAQAKVLARRGAMVDLQRNLLEFIVGVQVDSSKVMNDFMSNNTVRTEIHGIIKNVEALEGTWDGEVYTVKGRINMEQLRKALVPVYPTVEKRKTTAPTKSQPKKVRYTGLLVDVRHLPYVPAMTFNIYDQSGRAVYGMNFVNRSNYLQSGFCLYFTNINNAKNDIHIANNPIVAKAVKLGHGNVDIIISNSDAAKIRSSSYDFRKECKVIIVSK